MTRGILGLCALGFFFVGAAGQAKADLVVNGGFESGDFSPGWTVAGSFTFVDPAIPGVGGAGGFGTHSGGFYAAMGTVGPLGSISQTLSTTAGQSYTLDYWFASDGGTPNQFRVEWDGSPVFDQTDIPMQDYVEYTFTVTASTGSTVLEFFERNDPSYLSLDDVSVVDAQSAVPEPASLTLAACGIVGLLGYRWNRRNRPA